MTSLLKSLMKVKHQSEKRYNITLNFY
uniref:Uncharacterized protein n=1 Tax=Lepeophtheirus salmonis TaxID=72036 RepID=A0A0K2TKI8_LEPSM